MTPLETLHILQANSVGDPQKTIQCYVASSTNIDETELNEVWTVLVERFGAASKASEQILHRLHTFSPLKGVVLGKQLQELHDLCKIAHFNMSKSSDLFILNTASGLRPVRDIPVSVKLSLYIQLSYVKAKNNSYVHYKK